MNPLRFLLLSGGVLLAVNAGAQLPADQLDRLTLGSLSEFKELLSIPNDAHFPDSIEWNVRWCEKAFAARGFQAQRLSTPGAPLLLLERKGSRAGFPTLLCYMHVDGQPVDPSKWEQEDPWKPVLKQYFPEKGWVEIPWESLEEGFDPEWRIFARSASDDKGPILMLLTALDAMRIRGEEPPFHLKVILDFEEEQGSPHLPAAVVKYRKALACDALLIFDGPRHPSNLPTLSFGARGIATLTLTVYGPRVPQHSGHYGNWAPNPALRLARLLASMKDDAGRVTIPGFYDGIEIDEETQAILAAVPDDEAAIMRKLGIAAPDSVGRSLQEALQYPSLNIRGMASGWVGEKVRTIVPAVAVAEIDIRLVKESDPKRLLRLVREHIEGQGYFVTEDEPTEEERLTHPIICRFESSISYGAFRTPVRSSVGDWLSRALGKAFGQEPVKKRTSGGSVPISPFVNTLGVPAVGVPTVNPDNNQHSPNENIRLGNYRDGIQTLYSILTEPWNPHR